MARVTQRLTDAKIKQLSDKPGMHADGDGLYLQVKKRGESLAVSWVLRYMFRGAARYLGLGPLSLFSVAEARVKAREAHRLLHGGVDPIEQKRQAKRQVVLEAAKSVTFKAAAEDYIRTNRRKWVSDKHAAQWATTLATYAFPMIGDLPVSAIDTALVLKVLKPIWETKYETASRLRGRIETILSNAKVLGYRDGENPARWRGHLDQTLPLPSVRSVKHHEALSYDEVGAFMAQLRAREAPSARALEFAVLTATRAGEATGATRREFDLKARTWTIPAERMKTGLEHRIPLSPRAVEILAAQRIDTLAPDALVFPGEKGRLSNRAMLNLLQERMGYKATVHGFRATFKTWASERTAYPREVIELSLAHAIENKVEAAYQRGDILDKRRRLMDDWAKFCATPFVADENNVVTLRA